MTSHFVRSNRPSSFFGNETRPGGIKVTIALRVLVLDEEALRGRNVAFTANSAPHPSDQRCRRRAKERHRPDHDLTG